MKKPSNSASEHSSASMMRGAAKPALIASLLVTLIAFAIKGSAGLLGGLLASLVVVIFFSVSLLVSAFTKNADPITTFSLAMLSYFTKLTLVAFLLIAVTRLTDVDTVDRTSFGVGALVISGAWLLGEIRAFLRLKLELELPDKGSTDGSPDEGR